MNDPSAESLPRQSRRASLSGRVAVSVAIAGSDGRVLGSNDAWRQFFTNDSTGDAAFEQQLASQLDTTQVRSVMDALTAVLRGETQDARVPLPGYLDDIDATLELYSLSGSSRGDALAVVRPQPEQIDEDEDWLSELTSVMPIVFYVLTVDDTVSASYVSPGIGTLLGRTPGEVRASADAWNDLIHPDDRDHVIASRLRAAAEGEPLVVEYRALKADGAAVWLRDESIVVEREPGRRNQLGFMLDITARKQTDDQLVYQAFHDSLTGLPSRGLFLNRLEAGLARAERRGTNVAVLFLDLDRFKVVNDSLGHAAGDQLLVAVGNRIRTALRPSDTAARLGGDEFTVLVEDIDDPGVATRVAARLITELRLPFRIDGQPIYITTSVGIAFGKPGESLAGDVLRDADIALYRAKSEGRARYAVFDTTIDLRARERLRLETELRAALERDEFAIHYQPIVALSTGRIEAVEALLRWQHPERGMLLPGEFLTVAEESGLMNAIGQQLLEKACRQGRRWHDEFREREPIVVVVNVSANQFRQPGLAGRVRRALDESGLPPAFLRLEITEDLLTHDQAAGRATLLELKQVGVRVAIDGFGKGYSSLSYLADLPVDTLEIDRSFVSGEVEDGLSNTIMIAIASLARALGAGVSAEGIETQQQLAEVVAVGCSTGQGNYFSEAVTAEQLDALLAHPPGTD